MEEGYSVFSRRQFLAGSAAISLGAVMHGRQDQIGRLLADLGENAHDGTKVGTAELTTLVVPQPSFTFSVEREADLALLDFAFYGFDKSLAGAINPIDRTRSTVTRLIPQSSSNVITVQFPPQCIGEAAYNYSPPGDWAVDPPPVLSAVSGPSRLCFTVPTNKTVDFPTMTAADLLDWSTWILLVPTPAQVHGGGSVSTKLPNKPIPVPDDPTLSGSLAELLTYIEYPYALYLAPTVYASGALADGFSTTFSGRSQPLESPENIADCWTAALAQTRNSDGSTVVAQGVAVWADDYTATGSDATPETFIDYGAT